MKLILDTSAYSAFNRGDVRLRKWFSIKHEILIPWIVVGELRAGFVVGNQTYENEKLLQQFLDAPNVTTPPLTNLTTKAYSQVFKLLRQAGTPIGTNDMWIAAFALEHGAKILTLDADFARIPKLQLVSV